MERSRSRSIIRSEQQSPPPQRTRRIASVYDAVAGRIGLHGFLTPAQMDNPNLLPSKPEEVLLRRVSAPDKIPHGFYDADERLGSDQRLPDSDLLKAIHAYASDFYAAANSHSNGAADFRSFDETALLALGILLEEASKEALGENGDMVLVEPAGQENVVPVSKFSKNQVIGKVIPPHTTEENLDDRSSDELEYSEAPRRKHRRLD